MSVPEFLTTGTNYFTVALQRDGDVSISWQATNRSDALVGLTQGGGAIDPGPTDFSNASHLSAIGTTYEGFGGSFAVYGGIDLSFTTRKFKKR